MVLTATVVLILLQLHASDTLNEDNDEIQTQPTQKGTSLLQTQDFGRVGSSSRQTQRTITPQDEDLLDLMVRIAESPAEWERIHKVLNQLGVIKTTESNSGGSKLEVFPSHSSKLVRSVESINKQQTHLKSNSSDNITRRVNSSNETLKSKQKPSSGITADYDQEIYYPNDEAISTEEKSNTGTGWPDFEEAILKKVKKPDISKDVVESDWFQDDWFDSSLSDILSGLKDHEYLERESHKNPPVSFVPQRRAEEDKRKKPSDVSSSDMFGGGGNVTSVQNQTTEATNRTSRPLFLYHRVTTSPQERKNSAFIAVSVVKQNPLESPVSTRSPVASFWSQSRFLDRIQDRVEIKKAQEIASITSGGSSWNEDVSSHRKRTHQRHHPHSHTRTHKHHQH